MVLSLVRNYQVPSIHTNWNGLNGLEKFETSVFRVKKKMGNFFIIYTKSFINICIYHIYISTHRMYQG